MSSLESTFKNMRLAHPANRPTTAGLGSRPGTAGTARSLNGNHDPHSGVVKKHGTPQIFYASDGKWVEEEEEVSLKKLRSLEQEVRDLRKHTLRLTRDNDSLADIINAKNGEINVYKQEMGSVTANFGQLKSQIRQLQEMKGEGMEHQGRADALAKQLAVQSERADQAANRAMRQEMQLKELKRAVARLTEDNQQMQGLLQETVLKQQEAEELNRRLGTELADLTSSLERSTRRSRLLAISIYPFRRPCFFSAKSGTSLPKHRTNTHHRLPSGALGSSPRTKNNSFRS